MILVVIGIGISGSVREDLGGSTGSETSLTVEGDSKAYQGVWRAARVVISGGLHWFSCEL